MKILNNYVNIPLEKITPDPNQPRKYFDDEKIKTISATINSNIAEGKTGIINPIEVDENYQIITGECRWRASQLAGQKTIPAKILEISEDERYWRQGIENINRKNMTSMEESKWYWDVLIKMGWKPHIVVQGDNMKYARGQSIKGKEGFQPKEEADKYVKQLSQKLGCSVDKIYDKLRLQFENEEMKKFLQENDNKYSLVREVNKAKLSPEVKGKLKDKIINHTLVDRETTNALINSLKNFPEKEEELIGEIYTDRSSENIKRIGDIEKQGDENGESKRAWGHIVESLIDIESLLEMADYRHIQEKDRERAVSTAKKIIQNLTIFVERLEEQYPPQLDENKYLSN